MRPDSSRILVAAMVATILAGCGSVADSRDDASHPLQFVGQWQSDVGATMTMEEGGSAILPNGSGGRGTWLVRSDSSGPSVLCLSEESAVGAACEHVSISGSTMTWGNHDFRRR